VVRPDYQCDEDTQRCQPVNECPGDEPPTGCQNVNNGECECLDDGSIYCGCLNNGDDVVRPDYQCSAETQRCEPMNECPDTGDQCGGECGEGSYCTFCWFDYACIPEGAVC